MVGDFRQRGIGLKSICGGAIGTTMVSGEPIFNVFASLAQSERRLIQEPAEAGLTAARVHGGMGRSCPCCLSMIGAQTVYRARRRRSREAVPGHGA